MRKKKKFKCMFCGGTDWNFTGEIAIYDERLSAPRDLEGVPTKATFECRKCSMEFAVSEKVSAAISENGRLEGRD